MYEKNVNFSVVLKPGLTDPELKPGRVKKKKEKVMIQCNPADLAG
jgi:hypothetical protein